MTIQRRSLCMPRCAAIVLSVALMSGCAGARELMLVGDDEKVSWDDAGKQVNGLAGKDQVLVVDIGTDRLAPKIIARLPLMNTIFGPPTNLQITPDGKLALTRGLAKTEAAAETPSARRRSVAPDHRPQLRLLDGK